MPSAFLGRRNLEFVLYELLQTHELTSHERFADHDRETFDMVGAVAEAERHLQPLSISATARGDRPDQPHLAGLGELLRDRKFEPMLLLRSPVGGKEDPEALG